METATNWDLNFITRDDFKKNVIDTIKTYQDKLISFDLDLFNKNIIDPIKLIFDKSIYHLSWEEIIKNEIYRQRDKSNNNSIGYFHQNLFKYIKGCVVPKSGFDVIYTNPKGVTVEGIKVHTINAELKNKHNTMNSGSSSAVYANLQNGLLKNSDSINCLVEAIAKKSQNIVWKFTYKKEHLSNDKIRRISIDKFYEIVTGDKEAFLKICKVLPQIIEEAILHDKIQTPNDVVYKQLQDNYEKIKEKNDKVDFVMSLYLLGFSSYLGFDQF